MFFHNARDQETNLPDRPQEQRVPNFELLEAQVVRSTDQLKYFGRQEVVLRIDTPHLL